MEVEYQTHRIICPEHGVYVADVPWAYPGSGFTKDFDLTAAWLATYLPRSVVSEYFSGLIDKYSAIERLKYEKPNLQLCFCSQEILDKYLKYQGCEVI